MSMFLSRELEQTMHVEQTKMLLINMQLAWSENQIDFQTLYPCTYISPISNMDLDLLLFIALFMKEYLMVCGQHYAPTYSF
jgi:hypothetical protein